MRLTVSPTREKMSAKTSGQASKPLPLQWACPPSTVEPSYPPPQLGSTSFVDIGVQRRYELPRHLNLR